MAEWDLLGKLFNDLQARSPMLGRLWILLMLVFRILILATVASELFEDEQLEFTCNTLQPGCKQVCYDKAFPISQYRFWVFHIVLITTPSLLFLMYTTHRPNKKSASSKLSQSSSQDYREDPRYDRLYLVNVIFRILAEIGFIVCQYWLYGFEVKPQYPCNRFPCPHTVDCFTSRPAEKTIFLCFYFAIGVISAVSSCAELLHLSVKWFCSKTEADTSEPSCTWQNHHNCMQESEEQVGLIVAPASVASCGRQKKGSLRSNTSRKKSRKLRSGKVLRSGTLIV